MKIIRPLQISFNSQVLEQNRKFYFTVSATLGINLQTGEELLDLNYLKDIFECMGENPLPDMGMPKPCGEFLVSGSFYPPNGQPVTGGEVKVRLGTNEKILYIFGPRKWTAGLPSAPEKITSMALDYTNAFGGSRYEKNPDGIGFQDGLLPCIENPKHLVVSQKDKPEPACFAPLYPMLPHRMRYQGTYDADYKKKYFPGYPEDHDWKFFLCSPSDQWIKGYYNGDESYSLYHMHPEIPSIQGTLPGLYPRCFINQKTDEEKIFGELPLNLDTIWFFPEKLTGLLIFRGVTAVEDDEAASILDVLCAYEKKALPPRSLEYYKHAFEKRQNSDDSFLTFLNTQDLIPEDHKCAMEILMDTALKGDQDNEFANNMDAKADEMQKMADEKIEQALQEAEKNIDNIDIPDDAWEHMPDEAKQHMPGTQGGLDIRKLMAQKSDAGTDPDVDKFNKKLEKAIPGITSGDAKKLDMKNFSFDKLDEAMAAVDELVKKKTDHAETLAAEEIDKAKLQIRQQIKDIENQIDDIEKTAGADRSDPLKKLKKSKAKIHDSLKALEDIDIGQSGKKARLPRFDSNEITEQINETREQIDPMMVEALQHVQAMKEMGADKEKIEQMEKEIQEKMEMSQNQVEASLEHAKESIKEAEDGFKEGYIMAAHFMSQGTSPHKIPLDEVKTQFLDAVANNEDLSCCDWACIDLEGENLDYINLAGAFLEQVNFKGASLRYADLSKAILSRAVLNGTDLTGANLQGANIGAVKAQGANFTEAALKSARLSKGDFTGADFTNADLEGIESLEIMINNASFTKTHMSKVNFLEITFSGAAFLGADMDMCAFLKCRIEESDFTQSIMTKCAFVDTELEDCKFEKTDLSSACFVATDPEKSVTRNLNFYNACLKQANFQNMAMQNTNFSYADMENAFFGGADLSEAKLSFAHAKNAQFRKTNLTRAALDNINLDQGSLAKANLAEASCRGANFYGVDFLRSNISRTDFSGANLDTTLIEHWRPE